MPETAGDIFDEVAQQPTRDVFDEVAESPQAYAAPSSLASSTLPQKRAPLRIQGLPTPEAIREAGGAPPRFPGTPEQEQAHKRLATSGEPTLGHAESFNYDPERIAERQRAAQTEKDIQNRKAALTGQATTVSASPEEVALQQAGREYVKNPQDKQTQQKLTDAFLADQERRMKRAVHPYWLDYAFASSKNPYTGPTQYGPGGEEQQFFHPEELVAGENSPKIYGALQAAGRIVTPENAAIMAGTGPLAGIPGVAGKLAHLGISTYFAATMAKGLYEKNQEFRAKIDNIQELSQQLQNEQDPQQQTALKEAIAERQNEAEQLFGSALVEGPMAGLATVHAAKGAFQAGQEIVGRPDYEKLREEANRPPVTDVTNVTSATAPSPKVPHNITPLDPGEYQFAGEKVTGSGQQVTAPASPGTPQTKFKLPEGIAAQKVEGPVKGYYISTVQLEDGSTVAFDRRKTNAKQVQQAALNGELWKLTGEKAPAEAREQAQQEIKGEQGTGNKQQATGDLSSLYSGPEKRQPLRISPDSNIGIRLSELRRDMRAAKTETERTDIQTAIDREIASAKGEKPPVPTEPHPATVGVESVRGADVPMTEQERADIEASRKARGEPAKMQGVSAEKGAGPESSATPQGQQADTQPPLFVYHGTTARGAVNILKNGVKYGGIYLAETPEDAARYANAQASRIVDPDATTLGRNGSAVIEFVTAEQPRWIDRKAATSLDKRETWIDDKKLKINRVIYSPAEYTAKLYNEGRRGEGELSDLTSHEYLVRHPQVTVADKLSQGETSSRPSSGGTPISAAKSAKKSAKQSANSLTDKEAEQYFTPGKIVSGYGGQDKVVAFHPSEGRDAPYPKNHWSVDVIAVDKSGKEIPGERLRSHSTMPGRYEIAQFRKKQAAAPESPPRTPISTAKPQSAIQQGNRIAGNDGSATQVLTPGGRQEAKYRIVEAKDLKPSHDPLTFAKNPSYPEGVQERAYHTSKEAQNRVIQQAQNYEPSYTVNTNPDAVNGPPIILPDGTVLGGNSRAMSTIRLYSSGKGEAYRNAVAEKAQQFGLDPEAVRGMKEPVLVREIQNAPTETDAVRRMASDLNKSMTGALGVNERAVSAGKNIHPETLNVISGMVNELGDNASLRDVMRENGKALVSMMVRDGVITDRERPQFVDTATGGLSEEGKTFVERALLGSVVDDPNLMDQVPKSVLGKLEGYLGDIASVASRTDEYNLLPLLREALSDHAEMVRSGMTVDDFLRQGGMFGPERNPATDALIRALAGKPSEFRKAVRSFAADANYDIQNQGTLGFGKQPSAVEAFNAAFGARLTDDEFADSLLQSLRRQSTIENRGQEGRTRETAQGLHEPAGGNPPAGAARGATENPAGQAARNQKTQLGRPSERGSSVSAALPIPAIIDAATGLVKKGTQWYHGQVDRLLNWAHMGDTRPEIRQYDPDAADLTTKVDAAGQYHKAVSEMIAKKITGPLTEQFEKGDNYAERQRKNEISRDRMKGFHFMADAQNRAWLLENRPNDYYRWNSDPKIQKALMEYAPYENDLRAAVKQLGGKTIDEDYIKRIMDFATSGVAYEGKTLPKGTAGPEPMVEGRVRSGGAGRDNVISPQVDRSKARKAEGQFYWDHGVFDFGPSFEKRWVQVMSKLDEHRLAVHAMSMGTRIAAGEELPEKIFYNGKEFYRPDIAKEIKEVHARGVSPESKALADALGVDELPTPKNVREYAVYQPLARGSRFENAAAGLAKSVLASHEEASGTKLRAGDMDALSAQAGNLYRMSQLKYALPKEIVGALNDAAQEKAPGALALRLRRVLSPITQFIRQQIVGLAYGVPHMANILRKVVQVHPGSALNPLGWVDAFKVAFSRELKAHGISGPEDPGFDRLLRNAAISNAAIPDYKHYIEGNFDLNNWEGIKQSGKNLGNAFRQGGREGGKVTPLSVATAPFRLAVEPLNRFSEAGHNNLFKPGGIDQRARLWMHDFLKDRFPKIDDARIAHEVNQALGRYNRASWTDVQKSLAPFMLFPGWDYSSIAFALKHPFKTAVAPAVVVMLANAAVRALGGQQKRDDKYDTRSVHVGKYSIRTNLLNDNMGSHLWGWALRGVSAALEGKSRKEVTGEMVRGIPADAAGATIGTLNPLVVAPFQLGFNRASPGAQREIVPHGDLKKRGRILPNKGAEDLTEFGLERLFPLWERIQQGGQGPSLSSIAALGGVNVTKEQKKRRR